MTYLLVGVAAAFVAVLLVAAFLAVVVVIVSRKSQPEVSPTALPSAKTGAGANDPAQTLDVYQLVTPLADKFNSTAHPKDVLSNSAFLDAAKLLAASSNSNEALLSYLATDAPVIVTLVLEALAIRGGVNLRNEIIERLNVFVGPWSRYFALRSIDSMSASGESILGGVIAKVDTTWIDTYGERLSPQLIKEFGDVRVRRNEPLGFQGSLKDKMPDELDTIERVLDLLDDAARKPLRAELDAWRTSHLDTTWLSSFGKVWTSDNRPGFSPLEMPVLSPVLSRIETALRGTPRRSAVVLGESGVGKTAIIQMVLNRWLDEDGIVFEAAPHDLLAGQSYVGQFEERLQKLCQQLKGSTKIIWYLPHFAPLLHAGRHLNNPTGALETLLPFIETGKILLISESQPAQFERVRKEKPRLVTALEVVQLIPQGRKQTIHLAQLWAERWRPMDLPELVRKDVLNEAWELAEHYLSFTHAPGHLLELLERAKRHVLKRDGEPLKRQLELEDILTALSAMSGIPGIILDERKQLDLNELRASFSRRVLGQPEAVDCLVGRIALIKAGLTDPSRPLGVLMFAGPTGTGKTEIAKALTEFLFGSSGRMIRLDMSEFKSPDSIGRLIGDQNTTEGTLVDQIRKQPFSILLLDEFEKAHANIWDYFLQVFDDGRLTDSQGCTGNFRHCLIIMTSNMGAAIQTFGKAGFFSNAGEFSASNVRAALEREFRKEFLNRIDRIIVFRPLQRETMRGILRKELAGAYNRRGLRTKPWAVEWEDSAIEFLLEKGFTVDLGARPLKRAIEQYVLTPLATTIVNREAPSGDQFLYVRAERDKLVVDFIDPDPPPASVAAGVPPVEMTVEGLVLDAKGKRVEVDYLQAEYQQLCDVIHGQRWKDEKSIALSMMSLENFWKSEERFSILTRVEYRDRLETALETAESLLVRSQSSQYTDHVPKKAVSRVAHQLFLIHAALESFKRNEPWEAFLLIDSASDQESGTAAFSSMLKDMYLSWAEQRGMRVTKLSKVEPNGRHIFGFSGFGAYRLLAPETGFHILEQPKGSGGHFDRVQVHVRVAPQPVHISESDEDVRDAAIKALAQLQQNLTVVRRYREMPSPLVRDSVRNWRTGRLNLVLKGNFDLIGSTDD